MLVAYGSKGLLSERLHQLRSLAIERVERIDPEVLLTESVDVTTAQVMSVTAPEDVFLEWENISRTKTTESQVDFTDIFGRPVSQVHQKISFDVPVRGDQSVLDLAAINIFSGVEGDIRPSKVTFDLVHPALTRELIQAEIARWRQKWDRIVEVTNEALRTHRQVLSRDVPRAIRTRRDRLLRDRELDAALDIPLSPAPGVGPPPVPLRRPALSLVERQSPERGRFTPEPALLDADYAEILRQCESWARGVERSQGSVRGLGEEALRDHLLITLNTYWLGSATGETFNGAGKTDILIRQRDRNVFIAECKVWRGKAGATSAIDQLLRYLVWRDSKAALIVFIRNQRVTEAAQHLDEAVEGHERFIRRLDDFSSDTRKYRLRADEDGRTVELAVLAVAISTSPPQAPEP